MKTISLSSSRQPSHLYKPVPSNSLAFDRKALPCVTPVFSMRILLHICIYLVTTISGTMPIHQTSTSSSFSSTKTPTCYSLSQELIDPKYDAYFWDSVNPLHESACQPNVSETNQASAICLAVDSIYSGFQRASLKSLASKCCGDRCEMHSYIIKQCSRCSLTYVWFVLWTPGLYDNGIYDNDPIAARINIESNVWPRLETVRSSFEEWKRTSNSRIHFNTLNYSIKKGRGRRYLIIYRYKDHLLKELN